MTTSKFDLIKTIQDDENVTDLSEQSDDETVRLSIERTFLEMTVSFHVVSTWGFD